jgi:hypothetical protein
MWEEARLFDNHLDDHHMHRYTCSEGKQPPETFHPGPTNASTSIARAIREQRPIALVFADGSDIVARPPTKHRLATQLAVRLLVILDIAARGRDRPTFVLREWVTEFHAVAYAHGAQPVA